MGDHTTWYGGTMSEVYGNTGMYMKKMLDTLINVGYIDPLIVVCPDNFSTYEGSWYTNSTVTGNWEDFMAQEVVSWIDANYRTLAVPESRGIAGHSMGAYGAMKLAMKHPDVFGLVYAMSGTLEFARTYLDLKRDELIAARGTSNWSAFMDISLKIIISRALAYAPNAALSPFQGEFPLDEEGTLIDSTWQKWLAHDLYSMADEYVDKLRSLQGIRFDCGSDDESNISCTHFSDALTRLGIDHHYESYLGNHTDQISERMASKLFPFFSESLEQ